MSNASSSSADNPRDVWELISDAIYTLDAEWRFTYLNPVAERGAGRTRAELAGRNIWQLFPEAVGSDLWDAHQRVMADRQPLQTQTFSRAAGRLVQAHLRPLGGGGLLVLMRDVEEQERTLAELKAAEAELAASERLLRNVTDALPVLIAYVDADQRFRFANRAYEERFQRPREQILGHTLAQVFGPETYEARRPYIERALKGEQVLYEVPFRGSGETLETLVQHVPNIDDDGRVLGFYALVQDITPVRRAEAALRESEARLELALQASALGVWEWRLEGDEMIFSNRAREIWGFAPDEAVTTAEIHARTHPDDRADVAAQSARARDPDLREQRPFHYRIVLSGGQVRWIRAHGSAIFEETAQGPQAVRYVGTVEDITEQHVVLDQLSQSETRLRLALDAGRMAVWSIDADGRVTPSPEFNRIVGLPEDAAPTREQLQAQYYPGELERMRTLAAETIARGERYFEAEYRLIRADDRAIRWLLLRAEFQFDRAGAVTGALGVVLDITDRKEAEQRLRLLAREVDHRANNLLAVVQGVIALTKASTPEDYRQALTGRVSALARAHQLLASSRWTGADLKTLVLDELKPYAAPSGGPVEIKGPSLPLDAATAQGLAMAIHELATNAVKHGALSTADGFLSVTWEIPAKDELCTMLWTETGIRQPERRGSGLGMRVIDKALDGPIGGRVETEWRAEGLHCRLTFPVTGEIGQGI